MFKASFLNEFVVDNGISDVIEFGCGDGRQLNLARYPKYTGVDVSAAAVDMCQDRFRNDDTKVFILMQSSEVLSADLALSLDVIFHLVEDQIYSSYMERLFDSARRFVIVYSSNDESPSPVDHVRHRTFTDWVTANRADFAMVGHVKNPYPFDPAKPNETSFADFFIFEKRDENQ